ncbi:hypothetical protein FOCC_FOCC013922 [Frankliniella occidentalis]|nr:hypothetical protein FOCC_FOCC013922 [Frankliniella occidentalis]
MRRVQAGAPPAATPHRAPPGLQSATSVASRLRRAHLGARTPPALRRSPIIRSVLLPSPPPIQAAPVSRTVQFTPPAGVAPHTTSSPGRSSPGCSQQPEPTHVSPPPSGFGFIPESPSERPPNRFQAQWVGKLKACQNFAELEDVIGELTKVLQPPPKPQRPGGRQRGRGGRDPKQEAKRIQQLYKKNRKKAMRDIRQLDSPLCEVPGDEVANHFEEVFKETITVLPPPPASAVLPPTQRQDPVLVANIDRETITARLARCSETSPGADGITYSTIKRKDPGAHMLAEVYNACLRYKRIPAAWKESRTILLHKKGDKGDLGNWRPIALSSSLYKIYSGILADRLGRWAASTGAVSKVQKGFMPAEGCLEHNFIVQQAIDEVRESGRELTITWLDLRNAFGSVPHTVILEMLRRHGVHEHLVDVVQDAYQGCTTNFSTASGETRFVPMASGVKQGDPLSPITFNLALEVLIRSLLVLARLHGFLLHDEPIVCLGYADDLVVTAKSAADMQTLLDIIGEVATWTGLQFNAAKCATLHIVKKKAQLETLTFIQGAPIPTLADGDAYQHLGVPTGLRVDQTPEATIEAMLHDIGSIERSQLSDWQKLDALRTFVVPQAQFSLMTAKVQKQAFAELDREVKRVAKAALHLPQRASAEPVYLPPHKGGANLLPLGDLADIGAIVHAFKVLTCPDPLVRKIAETSAKKTVRRLLGHHPSNPELAEVLSGGPTPRGVHNASNIWTAARNASRRLSNKIHGFKWGWSASLERLEVHVPFPGKPVESAIVDSESRKLLHHKLRQGLQHHHLVSLVSKPDQGKVYAATCRDPASNHFYGSGQQMRFCDWRFIHRARLGVLPLNGCVRGIAGRDRSCRACGHPDETTAHVLNHCFARHSLAINNRHRAILKDVLEVMSEDVRRNTRVERCIAGSGSADKPDIVVMNNTTKTALIVDICCPFEKRYHALEVARRYKEDKYEHLVQHLRGRGFEASAAAIVVGSLGSWDPANNPILTKLGVPKFRQNKLKRKCVSDAIRWSRDIYVEHVTQQRQFTQNVTLPAC